MQVISRIKRDFSKGLAKNCSERGCRLRLNGLSNRVILKGEKICEDHKVCDFILFVNNNHIIIGIVELKSKTVHPSEVVEKLTNGSEIALNILGKSTNKPITVNFYHLVLAKGWRPFEYKVITSKKIIVREQKYHIIPKRCRVFFSTIISSLK